MEVLKRNLLQISIGLCDRLEHEPTKEEWNGLLEWAEKQTIVGFCFMAIERIEKSQRPPLDFLLDWFAQVEMIRALNEKQEKSVKQLCENLNNQGFRCCLLKGLGAASNSPHPLLRQCGDIDVWLDGERDDIIRMVKKLDPDAKVSLHHVDYPPICDMPVEIHFIPSYLINPFENFKLQKWYKKQKQRQFNSNSILNKEFDGISVPTCLFNLVFMLTHMYRHLLYEGLGLRQVIDYYYVLIKSEREERCEAAETIKKIGLRKFCSGMMWIMQYLFKMDKANLLMKVDEKEGAFILYEIEKTGNFCRNNNVSQELGNMDVFRKFVHHPSDVMWRVPHSFFIGLRLCIIV